MPRADPKQETTESKERTEKMPAKKDDMFIDLSSVDVSDHVEEKDTGKAKLKYLSWAWAWYEVRKRYPDATYTIIKNEQGLPYFVDPTMGIMVYTTVTIGGETHEMWLPVMDGGNNPMKLDPYQIKTKWGTKDIDAATMFDINKTVMRCLTKNLAMFGIGLALYAGEDLFDDPSGTKGVSEQPNNTKNASEQENLNDLINEASEVIMPLAAKMTEQEKNELAAKIKAKIGVTDWHKCQDVIKLRELIKELKAA